MFTQMKQYKAPSSMCTFLLYMFFCFKFFMLDLTVNFRIPIHICMRAGDFSLGQSIKWSKKRAKISKVFKRYFLHYG